MSLRITLILLLLCASAATAAAQRVESVYSDLDREKCKTLEYEHEGYSWTKECGGVAGYKLHHLLGDERESLTVVAPGGRQHPLDFWTFVTPAFSSVGQRAEWRVRRRGGRVEPFALIVRLSANEDPVQFQKLTSYLVVARLAPGKVCVVDRIAPGPRANELARQSADASADKPCVRAIGEQ